MGETGAKKTSFGAPLALGLMCVLAPGAAPLLEACSCAWSPVNHPCQSYSARSVVFLGRAIEERTMDRGRVVYTFTVEEAYHGVTASSVEITTDKSCGMHFEVGLPAFVHARRTRSGEELEVGLCGTRSTRDLGSPDVDYGRAVAAGNPGIAIFGRVAATPPGGGQPPIDGKGVDGVAVSVHRPDGYSLWAITDREGRFEIPGPLNGRYTVRAEMADPRWLIEIHMTAVI